MLLINIPSWLPPIGTLIVGGTLVTAVFQWFILPSRIRRARMEEQTEEFDLVKRTKTELEKANVEALNYMKLANENRDQIFELQEQLRQLSVKITMRDTEIINLKKRNSEDHLRIEKLSAEKDEWVEKYRSAKIELDKYIKENAELVKNIGQYQHTIANLKQRL